MISCSSVIVEYIQGQEALDRAVAQGDTYPLLGIADHAYWYGRWKELMKDKVWSNPASDRCAECGQSVPVKVQPVFKAGDIVEYLYGKGLGVVASDWVAARVRVNDGPDNVTFIELASGECWTVHPSALRAVHGYIHLDREDR